MYEQILVPTDGSEHAAVAAEHALAVGRALGARVHAISAVDVQGRAGVFDAGGVGQEFRGRLERECEIALERVRTLAEPDDNLRREMVDGDPVDAISAYVDAHDIDLIVMGTHGRTGISRHVAGSVTEAVLRTVDVPVVTVQASETDEVSEAETAAETGGTPGQYEEVLLPTDGSAAAEAAVEYGLPLAGIADARVHVVSVVDLSDVAASSSGSVATEVLDRLHDDAETAVERVAEQAAADGFETERTVLEGFPARDLLEYAADNDVDLITMGTHGRTGVSRFLLGSTAERVIRHATAPVLAVNTRELAAETEPRQ